MNLTNLITGTVVVVAIGAAVFQINQTRRVETDLAALARDRDGLRAQLRDVQQRAATAEQQNAALQGDLAAARTAQSRPVATRPASNSVSWASSTLDSTGHYINRTIPPGTEPAAAQRQLRVWRGEGIDAGHSALYRQLGWTSEQSERFKTLKLDSTDLARARLAAAKELNPDADRATLQAVSDRINAQGIAEEESALRSAFGEATFQAIQRYEATSLVRIVVNQLASELYYSDAPLTVPQAEQLVDIIAANSRNAEGKVVLTAMNTDAILAQASAVLSGSQLTALRRVQARTQER